MLAAGSVIAFGGGSARAAVIVNAVESGGNVEFTYSGTINTTGLTPSSTTNGFATYSEIIPFVGQVYFGNSPAQIYNWSSTASTFWGNSIGGGGSLKEFTLRSGPMFGIGGTEVFLPDPYVSNSSISGSMTFTGTFSSLGLNQGTYTATLPSDTITMNIGVAPVPAPLPLLGLGAATAFSRQLKQRIALRRKREEVGKAA